MTKPLSPAAQAVLNAAEAVSEYGKATPLMKARLAAALKAAADQVVLEEPYPNPSVQQPGGTHMYYREQLARWEERKLTRRDLLAIAAELEGE